MPIFPSGASLFTQLTDVPASYSGEAGKVATVNSFETGLEFTTPSVGAGDVVGPGSATDNAFSRMDGASGKLIQSSVVICNDGGDVTGMATLTLPNTGLHILDTNATHDLIIAPGSNLTSDRTLTIATQDSNRSLTFGGDLTFAGAVNIGGTLTTSAQNLTFTLSGATNVTLPTSGTVATLSNKITEFTAPTANLSMNSNRITNVSNAVDAQDAATKADLSAVVAGLLVKTNCNYASTANVAGVYVGTPAFTLTAAGFGALSIDGFTPAVGNRILLKDQTTAQENGIYTVTVVGDGGTAYVLTRATDFDASAEILTGAYTFIIAGTANAAAGYYLTTPAAITLDTTALSFTQFVNATNYFAGAGMTLSGLTFAVGSGTGITVNADSIEVDFTAVQAKDATLTALAAYNTNGILTQTAADTFTGRTLTTTSSGIVIANGDGVLGNPTINIDITALTQEASPSASNDYLLIYDASALGNKKALIADVVASTIGYHQVGTTPIECWYSPEINSSSATSTALAVAASTSTMYAIPFAAENGGTIDSLAVYVQTAVASTTVRFGIYEATSASNLYPNNLTVDAGESDTSSTGIKSKSISTQISPGRIYYFVVIADNSTGTATGPSLRGVLTSGLSNLLGYNTSLTVPNTMLTISGQTYGALPATFPAGAVTTTGTVPNGFWRFSA